MTEFNDYSTYMYPVWDVPASISYPHVTLADIGSISELGVDKGKALKVLKDANLPAPGSIKVQCVEYFGDNKDIPVLLVEKNPLLLSHRKTIEALLKAAGIEETSSFPFNPHVSIAYDGGIPTNFIVPEYVTLGAPELWWGDDHIAL